MIETLHTLKAENTDLLLHLEAEIWQPLESYSPTLHWKCLFCRLRPAKEENLECSTLGISQGSMPQATTGWCLKSAHPSAQSFHQLFLSLLSIMNTKASGGKKGNNNQNKITKNIQGVEGLKNYHLSGTYLQCQHYERWGRGSQVRGQHELQSEIYSSLTKKESKIALMVAEFSKHMKNQEILDWECNLADRVLV